VKQEDNINFTEKVPQAFEKLQIKLTVNLGDMKNVFSLILDESEKRALAAFSV
jgi:hypothetical protein